MDDGGDRGHRHLPSEPDGEDRGRQHGVAIADLDAQMHDPLVVGDGVKRRNLVARPVRSLQD
jgi:hypothetical protein